MISVLPVQQADHTGFAAAAASQKYAHMHAHAQIASIYQIYELLLMKGRNTDVREMGESLKFGSNSATNTHNKQAKSDFGRKCGKQ